MSRYPKISLDGALVAITGAARGIGLATVREFARHGAVVALGDLDADLAQEAAGSIRGASGHRLDVRDAQSFADFLANAEALHGRGLEVLVNNAGIMPNGPFLNQEPRIDQMTMEINVHGPINGMRLALPGMIERGRGHIVNVASLAGKFPLPGLAVYNASKYAVVGLTAATRLEYAHAGVSISAILPSKVRTELSDGIDVGVIPTVDPEDIAQAVVGSVRTRAAEIAVPRYVGFVADAAPLVPERVLGVVRRMLHDDAAISRTDDDVRQRYMDRITRGQ